MSAKARQLRKRNPRYWGQNLKIVTGCGISYTIRFDFYCSSDAYFKAAKAGLYMTCAAKTGPTPGGLATVSPPRATDA